MDRFEAMRAFTQVIDSGSFTRAARALGLHKATVSQQVQQLEERLGTRLLTRTTRSVVPTPEGLDFHAQACTILQQVDEAETRLRRGTAGATGHLRVNVPVAMGRLLFAPALRGFLEQHPRLTVELGCTDQWVDLVQEGVDCALRGGELPDSGMSARRVGALRFVLCAAPAYVATHGLPRTPADLAEHQQVGYLPAGAHRLRPMQLIDPAGSRTEVEPNARLLTTDSGVALSAGLDGLGLIRLARFVAHPYLISGALVPVLPAWQCPSLPLHLVTPTPRRRAARVQAFMDWAQTLLVQRLGADLERGR
ncbi:MAG: LysR family transcriptional regulator [Hydrogenophaga sp.]|jgi:LysR family transcriptional regulator for bpeEF and oprC|nr:LysR family transcriptional regulator [Hydrogenophaga sp.]